MKYMVIVKGAMNDSDCVEKTFIVDDINSSCFADFEDFEDCTVTYADIFSNFFLVLNETVKQLPNKYSNWTEKSHDLFYETLSKQLEPIYPNIPTDYLADLLGDFIPGNYDYPIHNIISISLIPIDENNITILC